MMIVNYKKYAIGYLALLPISLAKTYEVGQILPILSLQSGCRSNLIHNGQTRPPMIDLNDMHLMLP